MKTTDKNLAAAFNEWMRRYEKEPERFEHEYRTLKKFRDEYDDGDELSYGPTSVEYLRKILGDLGTPADDQSTNRGDQNDGKED